MDDMMKTVREDFLKEAQAELQAELHAAGKEKLKKKLRELAAAEKVVRNIRIELDALVMEVVA